MGRRPGPRRPHEGIDREKLYGTETGFAVVDAMMQILGGMGMDGRDMPAGNTGSAGCRVRPASWKDRARSTRFLIARDMLGRARRSGAAHEIGSRGAGYQRFN